MRYATVFLSHSTADKSLVRSIAIELGRRGIVPWLDDSSLFVGDSLRRSLKDALNAQDSVACFVSAAALESLWVREELELVLERERREAHNPSPILPVFLEDPATLARQYASLLGPWLRGNGAIDRVYVRPDDATPDSTAAKIASSTYRRLDLRGANDIAIVLDQRGDGARVGLPEVPDNVAAEDWPALVFRSDMGERSRYEVLSGDDWSRYAAGVKRALGEGIGPRRARPRRVHVLGNAQLALPVLVGRHFDRTSDVHLFSYGHNTLPFDLDLAPLVAPLPGGDPQANRVDDSAGVMEPSAGSHERMSVILATPGHLRAMTNHIRKLPGCPPAIWIPTLDRYDTSEQVVALSRDLTAVLRRQTAQHGATSFDLYTTLPFKALPILVATLTHVLPHGFRFMEFDRRGQAGVDLYAPLQIDG